MDMYVLSILGIDSDVFLSLSSGGGKIEEVESRLNYILCF